MTNLESYHELMYYTLSHRDERFIHQHIVDAYAAQMADPGTKPITIIFALAGLYLFLEKNYTGKQVQNAHIQMAKKPKDFGPVILPEKRGAVTVKHVLDKAPGAERDDMIRQWCVSVWAAFASQRDEIVSLTEKLLAV
jgi:hypothetical protein